MILDLSGYLESKCKPTPLDQHVHALSGGVSGYLHFHGLDLARKSRPNQAVDLILGPDDKPRRDRPG